MWVVHILNINIGRLHITFQFLRWRIRSYSAGKLLLDFVVMSEDELGCVRLVRRAVHVVVESGEEALDIPLGDAPVHDVVFALVQNEILELVD